MKRRKFIITIGSVAGTVTIGSHLFFIHSCTKEADSYNELFSTEDVQFLNELGEVIIPTTSTPGGKEAKVGEYMALVIKDCFSEEEQTKYREAMDHIDSKCKEVYGKTFLECDEIEKLMIVKEIDNSGYEHFFLIKEMIVEGYLTSEIGRYQFLTYHPVPGIYMGCTTQRPW